MGTMHGTLALVSQMDCASAAVSSNRPMVVSWLYKAGEDDMNDVS